MLHFFKFGNMSLKNKSGYSCIHQSEVLQSRNSSFLMLIVYVRILVVLLLFFCSIESSPFSPRRVGLGIDEETLNIVLIIISCESVRFFDSSLGFSAMH